MRINRKVLAMLAGILIGTGLGTVIGMAGMLLARFVLAQL